MRTPIEAPVRAVGGELVPAEDFATKTLPAILDTLVNPDAVAADASRDRLDLAKNAGAFELALDTADTILAGDALERMLAHQMATTPVLAMKAAAGMSQQLDIAGRTLGTAKQAACVEAARMAGTVDRLVPGWDADPAAGSGRWAADGRGAAQLCRGRRLGRDRRPAPGGGGAGRRKRGGRSAS